MDFQTATEPVYSETTVPHQEVGQESSVHNSTIQPCELFCDGPVTTPRTITNPGDIFRAYSSGEKFNQGKTDEAFLSHFTFVSLEEVVANLQQNPKGAYLKGFVGLHYAHKITIDIDDSNLEQARQNTIRLVRFLSERYEIPPENIPIYFSGRKGFHVVLHLTHKPAASLNFCEIVRELVLYIAQLAKVTIDGSVYEIGSQIRLPNTVNLKSGRFKRRITWDMLLTFPRV